VATKLRRRLLKAPVFLAALVPAAWLAWAAWHDALGANPISEITNETGTWTLRLLVVTLAITPLRRVTGWNWLVRYRRMIGLFAFFYASLHFLTYLWLDQFFDVHEIVKDVWKRPFITMGFTAFVLLVPLALTSTQGWIRRLGGRRWQALHRLVYGAAAAGVIHYWWLVKADTRRPIRYAVIVGILLLARVVWAWRAKLAGVRRLASRARPAPGPVQAGE
jgi:sulfoxide reductase heme-binding subunit YedZ